MESFDLKNPTVSMLTATNEAHSQEFFVKKDIQGGYFARTFIIYEHERQNVNSLMFPPTVKTDYNQLIPYMKEVAKLRGEMKMEVPQRVFFDKWYKSFIKSVKDSGMKDATGTLNRFDDSVLKVAFLISLSSSTDMIITQDALEEAIEACEKIVGNVRRTTMGSAPYEWVQHKTVLIQEILSRTNFTITRQQFLAKYWMMANARDWDLIAESLVEAGFIRIEQMGPTIAYVMDEEKAQQWLAHFKGKN
jgi:hypothetical protein